MLKKFHAASVISAAAILLAAALPLKAQDDPMKDADEATVKLIAECDRLIDERKYLSAFSLLDENEANQFIIAKKTDICLNYFVQSIMHQMFALKDLSPEEEIMELRKGTGSFEIFVFDPVKTINEYQKSHKESPLLYKTLGDYYYDILLRYPGNWLLPHDEVVVLGIENYRKAYAKNCFTPVSLSCYAEMQLFSGNLTEAVKIYTVALKLDDSLVHAHYNLSLAYQRSGNYVDSVTEALKSAEMYTDIEYKIDALLVASDSSYFISDYRNAVKFIANAEKLGKIKNRTAKRLFIIYMTEGDVPKSQKSADDFLAVNPHEPSNTQFITQAFQKKKLSTELHDFFDRNIKKFDSDGETKAILYLFKSYTMLNDGQKPQALENALQSKKYFTEAGLYEDELKAILDEHIKACGE